MTEQYWEYESTVRWKKQNNPQYGRLRVLETAFQPNDCLYQFVWENLFLAAETRNLLPSQRVLAKVLCNYTSYIDQRVYSHFFENFKSFPYLPHTEIRIVSNSISKFEISFVYVAP